MKYTFLSKQHQKCLDILEMVATRDDRISNKTGIVKHCNKSKQLSPEYIQWTKERIETLLAIKQRLATYYANTFMKMVEAIEVPA